MRRHGQPRAWASLAAMFAITGCVPERALDLPVIDGARTVVVFARDPGHVEARPFDLDQPVLAARTFARESGDGVFAVFFAETLDQLQLEPAMIENPADETWTRMFPRPLAAHVASLSDGAAAWTLSSTLPPDVDHFLLPPLDELACIDAGGCLDHRGTVERQGTSRRIVCELPCRDPPTPTPVQAPDAPRPPRAPDLSACPAGWTAAPEPALGAEAVACDPPELPAGLSCETVEAQWYGEAACRSSGGECPNGQWPEILPPGAPVRYVLAGAAPGGDGSPGAPFARVVDALSTPPAGLVVAIGRGTYRESITVPAGVTLIGACARETSIEPPDGAAVALDLLAGETVVRGLHVGAVARGISVAGAGTHATLDDVVIDGAGLAGIEVTRGAVLDARRIVIRDRSEWGLLVVDAGRAVIDDAVLEDNGHRAIILGAGRPALTLRSAAIRDTGLALSSGTAIEVQSGGQLALDHVAIERAASHGVSLAAASTATISNLHAVDVGSASTGYAITATDAALTLDAAYVRGARTAGVTIEGPSARALIRDLLVRGGPSSGLGLDAATGAHVEVTRARFEATRGIAVRAQGSGTSLALEHVFARGTSLEEGGLHGIGLGAWTGASMTVRRALVVGGAKGLAIYGGAVDAEDVTLRDLSEEGLGVGGGSTVDVRGLEIARATRAGVVILGEALQARVALADLAVRDTVASGDDSQGMGIAMDGVGLAVDLTRASISESAGYAIYAQDMSSLTLTDVDVQGTRRASSGQGEALFALRVRAIALERARFRATERAAIYLQASSLSAEDLEVDGAATDGISADVAGLIHVARGRVTNAGACAISLRDQVTGALEDVVVGEAPRSAGGALCMKDSAAISLVRFELGGAAKIGVLVPQGDHRAGFDTRLGLVDGVIRGHETGVEVIDPNTELLLERVRFDANDTNLETSATR